VVLLGEIEAGVSLQTRNQRFHGPQLPLELPDLPACGWSGLALLAGHSEPQNSMKAVVPMRCTHARPFFNAYVCAPKLLFWFCPGHY
jgi:hypothetical protein